MSRWSVTPLSLLGVLLLATALRLWGIGWGVPSPTHYFSYHPDESVVLSTAMGMNVFRGDLLPHFYRYGSLQLYLVLFANTLAYLFGGVSKITISLSSMAADYAPWARMYLIGRLVTVTMGVGTVWATFALGTHLWGRRAGFLAALVLAILPLHAQHSHWLTVDVPATFWGTLSLFWSVRLAFPPMLSRLGAGGAKGAILAGLFAGLAAATKYNMALALLPFVAACILTRRWRLLPLGLVAAGGAFLLACPGAVLEPQVFLHDLNAEAVHVSRQPEAEFLHTGSGFMYHITRNLDAGLGLPLLLLAIASIGWAAYRHEHGDALLAAFALPYYILIGLAAVRYARYTIPLLPILALWTGRLVADLTHRILQTSARALSAAVAAGILLFTLGDAIWLMDVMAAPDTRDQALAWLNTHAPSPTPVGFPTQPWFGTVPLSPYFPMPRPGAWREVTSPEISERIVYNGKDWNTSLLETARPSFVVLSEFDDADALRLNDPAATQYLKMLNGNYALAARFARGGLDGRPPELPHDMAYPSPAIQIYERR